MGRPVGAVFRSFFCDLGLFFCEVSRCSRLTGILVWNDLELVVFVDETNWSTVLALQLRNKQTTSPGWGLVVRFSVAQGPSLPSGIEIS